LFAENRRRAMPRHQTVNKTSSEYASEHPRQQDVNDLGLSPQVCRPNDIYRNICPSIGSFGYCSTAHSRRCAAAS